jgi:hypothetical protein
MAFLLIEACDYKVYSRIECIEIKLGYMIRMGFCGCSCWTSPSWNGIKLTCTQLWFALIIKQVLERMKAIIPVPSDWKWIKNAVKYKLQRIFSLNLLSFRVPPTGRGHIHWYSFPSFSPQRSNQSGTSVFGPIPVQEKFEFFQCNLQKSQYLSWEYKYLKCWDAVIFSE